MNVLITGSNGFMGKNLKYHLDLKNKVKVFTFNRNDSLSYLLKNIDSIDFIFHLAGANRPKNDAEFNTTNVKLTNLICQEIVKVFKNSGKKIPILFASSTQSGLNNLYGKSKKEAENILLEIYNNFQIPILIYRLPNVFGKWCKPNYNSVVATFCYNIIRNIPIKITEDKLLNLVYIDDVISDFISSKDDFEKNKKIEIFQHIKPNYQQTVKQLRDKLISFKEKRKNYKIDQVGSGFIGKLYSTYISYLPPEDFSVKPKVNRDARGIFVELLKTQNCGQFSFFTAHPGVKRGSHYHHSKTEKFVVLQGKALFKFHNLENNLKYEIIASEDNIEIIDTSPGWAHNITNIGDKKLVVMLWVNEVFDPKRPDTIGFEIQ